MYVHSASFSSSGSNKSPIITSVQLENSIMHELQLIIEQVCSIEATIER